MKQTQAQIEAIAQLREELPPGTEIYTTVTHVAKSGMSRSIRLFHLYIKDGKPHIWDISHLAAKASARKIDDKNGGIKILGCGQDMGFALVYDLSRELYPEGFDCIGEECPSNDHFNNVVTPHHNDGGYALKQRWL